MTNSDQKRRERSILDRYLSIIDIDGDIRAQERPDFIVTSDHQTIGVEITEYHQPKQSEHEYSRTLVEAEWQRLRSAVVEYRDSHVGLEGLSVLLSFIDLNVPHRSERQAFIEAVHAEIARVGANLGDLFTTIRINERHPPVLSRYLRQIDVRIANCYIEWDWNHMVGGVGTTEEELLGIVGAKLNLKRAEGIDKLHLVIAGDGPTVGSYIGYLTPDRLEHWTGLTTVLCQSDYDTVAILNYEETCIWRKGHHWSWIGGR